MSPGTVLVLLLLIAGLFFALRAIRHHKSGGCCGDCAKCAGCAAAKNSKE
ncbi:MAG: FeoB-associated Cys-rich membrane protein [Ruminococcus bromii]|nr:FeoB-associated Cys-rich membrane protein [Ruminococcus bromii]